MAAAVDTSDLLRSLLPTGDWDMALTEAVARHFEALGQGGSPPRRAATPPPPPPPAPAPAPPPAAAAAPAVPGRGPTVMQKVLFTVRQVDAALARRPGAAVLLAVPRAHAKQYAQCLKDRCRGAVRLHQCLDDTEDAPTPEHWAAVLRQSNVVITTLCPAGKGTEAGASIPLEPFTALMVDVDGPGAAMPPLLWRWAALSPEGRPEFIDIAGLGRLPGGAAAGASVRAPESAAPSEPLAATRTNLPPTLTTPEAAWAAPSPPTPVSPFDSKPGVQVTVANCVEMFNDYCRAVLGPEFDPAVLLQYRGSPLDPDSVLQSVQYPESNGLVTVTQEQVKQVWNGLVPSHVMLQFDIPDLKEAEKRWFLYAVALHMAQRGLRAARPQPETAPPPAAGRPSPDTPPRPHDARSVSSSMSSSGSISADSARSSGSSVGWVGLADRNAANLDVWLPNKDPKSLLNELRHKIADLGLVYDTNPVPNRSSGNFFQSVLHVRFQSSMYTFAGEVSLGKKIAEQSAALAAVRFIIGGGLGQAITVEKAGSRRGFDLAPASQWIPPVRSGSSSPTVTAAPAPRKDPKAQLSELIHRLTQHFAEPTAIDYTSQQVPAGWLTTVHITGLFGTCSFTGEAAPTQRQAEALAVAVALDALVPGGGRAL